MVGSKKNSSITLISISLLAVVAGCSKSIKFSGSKQAVTLNEGFLTNFSQRAPILQAEEANAVYGGKNVICALPILNKDIEYLRQQGIDPELEAQQVVPIFFFYSSSNSETPKALLAGKAGQLTASYRLLTVAEANEKSRKDVQAPFRDKADLKDEELFCRVQYSAQGNNITSPMSAGLRIGAVPDPAIEDRKPLTADGWGSLEKLLGFQFPRSAADGTVAATLDCKTGEYVSAVTTNGVICSVLPTSGAQGSQGAQGSAGVMGPQGYTGAQGNSGATGPQGVAGSQGSVGTQGAQGSAGSGAQGAQGAAGAQGNVGAQGNDGTGATGAQGTSGNTILSGTANPNAGDGVNNDHWINTTAGTLWKKVTGTWNNVLNLVGNTGAQGSTGAQGDVGGGGAQGPQGHQGSAGSNGAQGDAGAAGGTGPQGFTGSQGAQGAQGAPAANNGDFMANGSVAMTADLNAGSHKIVNVTAPTSDNDAANKAYVDAAALSVEEIAALSSNGESGYFNRIAPTSFVPTAAYTEICFKAGSTQYDIHAASETTAGGNCLPGDIGFIFERDQRSGTKTSWSEANAYCLSHGMRLASVFEAMIAGENRTTYSITMYPQYDGSNYRQEWISGGMTVISGSVYNYSMFVNSGTFTVVQASAINNTNIPKVRCVK